MLVKSVENILCKVFKADYSKGNPQRKKHRRASGEGGICKINKHGNLRYKATVTTGYDSKGRQIKKSFICKTEKEALSKLNNLKNSLNNNPITNKNNITFGEWLDSYQNNHMAISCGPSTYEKREAIFRNYIKINPKLIKIKLRELSALDLQEHYNQLMKEGKNPQTLKNNNTALITALNVAVGQGYININPAKHLAFPRGNRKEKYPFLSTVEYKKFLSELDMSQQHILLKLALFTGMRLGEIRALTWSDIDFNNRTITINKSLDRVKKSSLENLKSCTYKIVSDNSILNNPNFSTVLILVPTKNKSNRSIHFPAELIEPLNYLFKNRISDIVFPDKKGLYTDTNTTERIFKKILKDNSIHNIPLHGLRHTYASIMFSLGFDIKTVSDLLGNDDLETTSDIYIHVTKNKKIDAANKLNEHLLNIK